MKTASTLTEPEILNLSNKFTRQERDTCILLSIETEKPNKTFWNIQESLSIAARMNAYQLLVLDALYNKDMSEVEFIKNQLEKYYPFLKLPTEELKGHELALHNITSYIKFLENRMTRIGEKELDQTINEFNKIPSNLKKSELVAFLVLVLKDSGILMEEVNDYQLGVWIERSFLFQGTQTMKFVKQEISKFRRLEHDTTKFQNDIQERLKKAKIKINDELN